MIKISFFHYIIGVTAGAASTTVETAVSMDSEAVDGEATVETVEAETVPLGRPDSLWWLLSTSDENCLLLSN